MVVICLIIWYVFVVLIDIIVLIKILFSCFIGMFVSEVIWIVKLKWLNFFLLVFESCCVLFCSKEIIKCLFKYCIYIILSFSVIK